MAVQIAGFDGQFTYDRARQDGMMRKGMTSARAQTQGWVPATPLPAALTTVVQSYEAQNRD
jgi:hypothetical protein